MQHSLYIRCVHWSPAVLVRRNMNDFCQQLRARYQIVEGDMSFAADNFAEVPQNLESSPSLQGDMANKVEALGLADSFEAPALGSDSFVAPALNGFPWPSSLKMRCFSMHSQYSSSTSIHLEPERAFWKLLSLRP